jgi:hypothetical protein
MMKRFILIASGVLYVCPAPAATIVAAPIGPRDSGAIVVSGILKPGDDEVFSKLLMQFPKGVVVFQGDGGDLQAAIQIGTAIRLKNYATLVSTNSRCASACAVAWLGGSPRLMEDGAQIGFHAAYAVKNGQLSEIGVPNALLGVYLGKIGLPDRAVVYITESPPDSMTWLRSDDAEKEGIDVRTITEPKAPSSGSSIGPTAKLPSRNPQEHIRLQKPSRVHVEAKHNRYFVSWMVDMLRRLSVAQSSKLTVRDDSSRSR